MPLEQAHKGNMGNPITPSGGCRLTPGNARNSFTTIFEEGLGGNWPAQKPPGDHTIHLGRGNPHVLKPGTDSEAKSCFSGVPLLLKISPRPSREPDSRPRARWWVQGPKCGPQGQKYQSCALKSMQKTVVNIPNGAICCKSWPKTILRHWQQNLARIPGDKRHV